VQKSQPKPASYINDCVVHKHLEVMSPTEKCCQRFARTEGGVSEGKKNQEKPLA